MSGPSERVAAILLCGGSSRRLGWDKTRLEVDGVRVPRRTATLLRSVVASAVEVGPGVSGLVVTREEPVGSGPLAAIAAGWQLVGKDDHVGALVIAGDLPFVSDALLRLLVEWESDYSVVPVVAGRDQPLCARWSRADLDDARGRLAAGERSMKHLANRRDVAYLDESAWGRVATAREFADVDTPDDLRLFGLAAPADTGPVGSA